MDFGIAKAGGTLTQTGQVLGTPNYMSPEQVRGKPLDGRSDLFSLAVVLYEMLTGEKPFSAQSVTTIIYKIVNEQPIPPRELDVSIHPGLSAVVTKALSKNPDDRYQSGMEFASALENYKSFGSLTGSMQDSATVVLSADATSLDVKPIPAPAVPITPLPESRLAAQQDTIEETRKPGLAATQASHAATLAVPAPIEATQKANVVPHDPLPTAAAKSPTEKRPAVREEPKRSKTLLYMLIALLAVVAVAGVMKKRQADQLREMQSQISAQPAQAQPEETKPAEPAATPPAETPQPATAPPVETKPAATTGELRILSKPEGAAVLLDGKAKGVTPLTEKNLAPGKHTVELSHEGYETAKHSAEVKAGETARVDLILAPSNGTVKLSSVPAGADVAIDGRPTGMQTPAEFTLSKGDHSFTLTKKGFQEAGDLITVNAGQTMSLTPELRAQPQTPRSPWQRLTGEGKVRIQVKTDPPGAWIFVNGRRLPNQTPTAWGLPPGSYRIALRKQGFRQVVRDITVEQGNPVTLNERLQAKPGPEE
jgi:hypothetical protein